MNREDAVVLLKKHLNNEMLLKHSFATEAIMRKLAEFFGENIEKWGLIGLLHDLDFEQTKDNPSKHSLITEQILKENNVEQEIINVIKSHNVEEIGGKRDKRIEFALTAAETITGLIVATTLVYPDKKISSVKSKSVKKRMKEKAFARSVSRERIRECEQLGIEFPQFVELSLEAMRGISDVLGL